MNTHGFPGSPKSIPRCIKRIEPPEPIYLCRPFVYVTEEEARANNRAMRDKYASDLAAFQRGECIDGCPGCAFPMPSIAMQELPSKAKGSQVSPQATP